MYGLFRRNRKKINEPEIVIVYKYDDGLKDPESEFPKSESQMVAMFINPNGDVTQTWEKAEEWVRSLHGEAEDAKMS